MLQRVCPESATQVRYDGIYRILRSWRKPGNQGPLVCRYLFMRCDNSPAPWSSAGGCMQQATEARPQHPHFTHFSSTDAYCMCCLATCGLHHLEWASEHVSATCVVVHCTGSCCSLRLTQWCHRVCCWATETGDEVRMEIPPEAEEEMTQAKGKIHEICPDPYWWVK